MDETSIKIEKAKPKDFDNIIRIEELSYRDPWPREVFMLDYLFNNSSEYFVLKNQGKIIGFIGMWLEDKRLHIINVTVHPDERGRGFGRIMISFAIKCARQKNMKEVYLEARSSNLSAIKLYESIGFRKKDELSDYYQDGEDGVRMSLDLGGQNNDNLGY